jgi:sugar lactone lactonase YvrE
MKAPTTARSLRKANSFCGSLGLVLASVALISACGGGSVGVVGDNSGGGGGNVVANPGGGGGASVPVPAINIAGAVSTLAGTGAQGFADGAGNVATFDTPDGVAVDSAGNVYVADQFNNKIRKVTPAGVVSTFAGTGVAGFDNGPGNVATFKSPQGLATDSADNVYVADASNHAIRKITPAGQVSTLVGTGVLGSANGLPGVATFHTPTGVAVDSAGNVYVADSNNNKIRRFDPIAGVSDFAGTNCGFLDGPGNVAKFCGPTGVATDNSGNIYVVDRLNDSIRKLNSLGAVSTFAGSATATGSADGPGISATFLGPQGLATDGAGNVYVADSGNSLIRKITPAGVVSTYAGARGFFAAFLDGAPSVARFNAPRGVATDSAGNVYVADTFNHRIRKITP